MVLEAPRFRIQSVSNVFLPSAVLFFAQALALSFFAPPNFVKSVL